MESLAGIMTFVAVADSGSFVAAGRGLGISSSAVGKSIARLEAQYDTRLFERSTRRLRTTPAGARFLDRCRRILAEIRRAETELLAAGEADGPPTRLRLGVPAVDEIVLSVALDLLRGHELQALDIGISAPEVSLAEQAFDLVLCTARPVGRDIRSLPLGRMKRVLVAADAYRRERGLPSRVDELTGHRCLSLRMPGPMRAAHWQLDSGLFDPARSDSAIHVAGSVDAVLYLLRAGAGIARVPECLVAGDIALGRMHLVLPGRGEDSIDWHVAWPANRDGDPALCALVERLRRAWRWPEPIFASSRVDTTLPVPTSDHDAASPR